MKINLKKVLILCILCMMILGVRVFAFEDGDYVKLGTYNGQEILWRVVLAEDSHLNLISDKILDFKQFDDTNNGAWKTSTLRQWLNNGETGFLKDFTAEEKEVLTTASYQTVVNKKNRDSETTGDAEHIYSRDPKKVAKKHAVAYKQSLTDAVTLPSVADIQTIANGIYTYGTEYQVASLAANLTSSFGDGNSSYYWLRDAMFATDTSLVRCMRSDNTVEYERANNGKIGVRPICFVKSNIAIVGGDGSADAPYVLRNTPQVRLTAPYSICLTGSEANISLTSVLLPEGASYKVYSNSKYVGSTTNANISVEVAQGANIITVEVFDANGDFYMVSEPIRITGVEFPTTERVAHHLDFEDATTGILWTARDGFSNGSSYDESTNGLTSYNIFEIIDHPTYGKLLEIRGQNGKTGASMQLYNFPSDYEVTAFEMDFSVQTLNVIALNLFNLKLRYEDDSQGWIYPLTVDAAGNFKVNHIQSGSRVLTVIEQGKWYNVQCLINNQKNTLSIVLTEQGKTPQLLCYDEPMERSFKYVNYGEFTIRNTEGGKYYRYVDNVYVRERTQNTEAVDSLLAGAHIVDGTQTVSVALNNTADRAVTPLLMRATYQNKKLVAFSYDDTTEVPADSSKIAMLESDTAIPTGATTKVFAWSDFTGMVPLNDAITVK